ncbi:MAG: dockerin type I repeat-containing protein [Deltaproteobacteria bacterium]|nr:MAG: dockerin type I repeat-containing protein [Deltaproteobacteria bacterium]
MKSKILIMCLLGILLLFGLSVSGTTQQLTSPATPPVDSVDIAIIYKTAYPGSETWLEVRMRNPMEVWGYQLSLMMSGVDVAHFCCDDTGGCVVAPGGVFDGCTCSDGGVSIWWNGDMPIPPTSSYHVLFRICASTCCMPDTSTDRNASIYMFPGMGWVVDGDGQAVPIRYHQGDLTVWWSVPGDASGDSLVTIADAVFLVNYLYRQGSEPCICEGADANWDCLIDLGDLVYLLNYLFRDGPDPLIGCARCPHEDCRPE